MTCFSSQQKVFSTLLDRGFALSLKMKCLSFCYVYYNGGGKNRSLAVWRTHLSQNCMYAQMDLLFPPVGISCSFLGKSSFAWEVGQNVSFFSQWAERAEAFSRFLKELRWQKSQIRFSFAVSSWKWWWRRFTMIRTLRGKNKGTTGLCWMTIQCSLVRQCMQCTGEGKSWLRRVWRSVFEQSIDESFGYTGLKGRHGRFLNHELDNTLHAPF